MILVVAIGFAAALLLTILRDKLNKKDREK
jgi:hypothetical protein